ncbi:MAG: hypothetical protein L3V56_03620 [Candidatus Magnetoovum sp. WYHC-5]|nr:hypothetical protein [Candidatus Magnetoovum sp. WYHC-5]
MIEIPVPNIEEKGAKASSFVKTAQNMVINNQPAYEAAAHFLVGVKTLAKEIETDFKPAKEAANKAHKTICEQERKHLAPLTKTEKLVKDKMVVYEKEENERIRLQNLKDEKEAKSQDEERQLHEAEVLEALGEHKEAEKVLVLEQYVPPPAIPFTQPQTKGVSTKTIWKYKIVDETQIPREYMKVDDTKLSNVVKALGASTKIPGILVYSETVVSVRASKG